MFCGAGGRGIFNLSALLSHKLLEQELHQVLLQLTIFQKYRVFEKIITFAYIFRLLKPDPWKWKVRETDSVLSVALSKERALCSQSGAAPLD